MSKAAKARNKLERKAKKMQAKRARKALYLAQAAQGKTKGEHHSKRKDPNRYGKIAERARH